MANNEAKNDMETTEVMEEDPLEGKENKDHDTDEEENSPTVLRKKLKFYKKKKRMSCRTCCLKESKN